MKKRRSPQEKKELSLKKDRRSIFDANPEASRKGVRRAKRAANKLTRHNAKTALDAGTGEIDDLKLDKTEISIANSKRKSLKRSAMIHFATTSKPSRRNAHIETNMATAQPCH